MFSLLQSSCYHLIIKNHFDSFYQRPPSWCYGDVPITFWDLGLDWAWTGDLGLGSGLPIGLKSNNNLQQHKARYVLCWLKTKDQNGFQRGTNNSKRWRYYTLHLNFNWIIFLCFDYNPDKTVLFWMLLKNVENRNNWREIETVLNILVGGILSDIDMLLV